MKNIKIAFSIPTLTDAKNVAEKLATKAAKRIITSDEERLLKLQNKIKESKIEKEKAAEIAAVKEKYSKQMNA